MWKPAKSTPVKFPTFFHCVMIRALVLIFISTSGDANNRFRKSGDTVQPNNTFGHVPLSKLPNRMNMFYENKPVCSSS
jgi:hypothetical protein